MLKYQVIKCLRVFSFSRITSVGSIQWLIFTDLASLNTEKDTQEVSCRSLTQENQRQSHSSPYGIYGGQSDTGVMVHILSKPRQFITTYRHTKRVIVWDGVQSPALVTTVMSIWVHNTERPNKKKKNMVIIRVVKGGSSGGFCDMCDKPTGSVTRHLLNSRTTTEGRCASASTVNGQKPHEQYQPTVGVKPVSCR